MTGRGGLRKVALFDSVATRGAWATTDLPMCRRGWPFLPSAVKIRRPLQP
jgi:hypothetical protein